VPAAVDVGPAHYRRLPLGVAGSNSLDELTLYVGLYGFPFEVHEPPELVAQVRELAARLAAAADRQRGRESPPFGGKSR
jgi:hypothetical protein